MKRRDLLRSIRAVAKAHGLVVVETEGGSHTKIRVGDRQTVVPRHAEINELTARAILKQVTPEEES